jgi:hypothetical protein
LELFSQLLDLRAISNGFDVKATRELSVGTSSTASLLLVLLSELKINVSLFDHVRMNEGGIPGTGFGPVQRERWGAAVVQQRLHQQGQLGPGLDQKPQPRDGLGCPVESGEDGVCIEVQLWLTFIRYSTARSGLLKLARIALWTCSRSKPISQSPSIAL